MPRWERTRSPLSEPAICLTGPDGVLKNVAANGGPSRRGETKSKGVDKGPKPASRKRGSALRMGRADATRVARGLRVRQSAQPVPTLTTARIALQTTNRSGETQMPMTNSRLTPKKTSARLSGQGMNRYRYNVVSSDGRQNRDEFAVRTATVNPLTGAH